MSEQPKMNCPKCLKEYDDFDGAGVVYCEPPEGCGFCRHIALTGGACDFCKQPPEEEGELDRLRGSYYSDRASRGEDIERMEFLISTRGVLDAAKKPASFNGGGE